MTIRSIIKKSQVQLEGHDVNNFSDMGASGSRHHQASGKRSARLVKIDGVARAVELTCTCGEAHMIELELESDQ